MPKGVKVDTVERIGDTNKFMIRFNSNYEMQNFLEQTPMTPEQYMNRESRGFYLKHLEDRGGEKGYYYTATNYEEKWVIVKAYTKDIMEGLE